MIQETRKIKEFTDLLTWRSAYQLVMIIYKTTKLFPTEESFGLTSQMRRAAISIVSNIAEGFGRHTYKEKTRFYYIAQGSLTELKNQIFVAKGLNYLNQTDFKRALEKITTTHKLLQGLIRKTKILAS